MNGLKYKCILVVRLCLLMRADEAVWAIMVICKLQLGRKVDEDEKTDKLQPLRTNWSSNLLFATSNPSALDGLQENLCSDWDLHAHTVQEVKKLEEQIWWEPGWVWEWVSPQAAP